MYKVNITQTNPHTFGIYLSSGYYYFKLYWIDVENAGWYLDIKDSDLNNLVCGIPLVCNTNLTRQYKYKVPFDLIIYSEQNYNPGRYELQQMEMIINE